MTSFDGERRPDVCGADACLDEDVGVGTLSGQAVKSHLDGNGSPVRLPLPSKQSL